MNAQLFSSVTRRLKIFTAVVPQTQIQILSNGGPLDHLRVTLQLIADRRPTEIGPIRIEALPHHEIDLAEVDVAHIEPDIFGIAGLWAQFPHVVRHRVTISAPSNRMVDRLGRGAFKGQRTAGREMSEHPGGSLTG